MMNQQQVTEAIEKIRAAAAPTQAKITAANDEYGAFTAQVMSFTADDKAGIVKFANDLGVLFKGDKFTKNVAVKTAQAVLLDWKRNELKLVELYTELAKNTTSLADLEKQAKEMENMIHEPNPDIYEVITVDFSDPTQNDIVFIAYLAMQSLRQFNPSKVEEFESCLFSGDAKSYASAMHLIQQFVNVVEWKPAAAASK